MSCPTCGHSIQTVSTTGVRWCPRCGTLTVYGIVEPPSLVGRVRVLLDSVPRDVVRLAYQDLAECVRGPQ